MNHRIRLYITGLIIFSMHTMAESADDLKSLDWLIGHWRSEYNDRITEETWIRVSPLTFEGTAVQSDAGTGQPAGSESLRLICMSGEIFYLAKVSHNPFPVPFRLTHISDSLAVFENPAHDFPQKLVYRLAALNRLEVEVSGGDSSFEIEYLKETQR